ncbi:hypothetical protein AXF42_Ash006586 [Apostasia shenzhenica]|uniref:Uncharacterized protein n=1 Tax=Apostasia shenzhenica TaxID=1088818 RepID=A0A2I0AIJ3_9ASPA|nr:hypothetical protein AXF42_Ash006586 [Apostasia shenzhenica]
MKGSRFRRSFYLRRFRFSKTLSPSKVLSLCCCLELHFTDASDSFEPLFRKLIPLKMGKVQTVLNKEYCVKIFVEVNEIENKEIEVGKELEKKSLSSSLDREIGMERKLIDKNSMESGIVEIDDSMKVMKDTKGMVPAEIVSNKRRVGTTSDQIRDSDTWLSVLLGGRAATEIPVPSIEAIDGSLDPSKYVRRPRESERASAREREREREREEHEKREEERGIGI